MSDEEFEERMEAARARAAARRVRLDAMEVELQAQEDHAVRLNELVERCRLEMGT